MKKMLSIILCALIAGGALMSLAACGPNPDPLRTEPDAPDYENDTQDTPDISTSEITTTVTLSTELQEKVNNHISDFSVQMFKRSVEVDEDGNTLVSPISVYTLLSLLANGADFTTKTEIIDTLSGYYQYDDGTIVCYANYDPLTTEELNAYFFNYMNNLNSTENSKLSMANSVWVNNDAAVEFNDDFLSIGKNNYHSEVLDRSFDEKMLKELNGWVEKNTDGMIEKVLDEIPYESVMFLVNALAFDAEWEEQYDENQIIDNMEFNNYDGSQTKTEFLSSVENKYLSVDNARGFVKNYEGGNYSFIALLPDEDINIDDYIENWFLPDTFSKAISTAAKGSEVHVMMPKFDAQTDLDLKEVLKKIGISISFDEETADFSRLGKRASEEDNLVIGTAVHKTYISVDEKGTKAAAVTLFGIGDNAAATAPETYYVTLDRPFVYAIYDNNSQMPIFIGTVKNL